MQPDSLKKSRIPDSLVLIFGMIFIAQMLSYIIPQGMFEREVQNSSSREMIVPGSYEGLLPDQLVSIEPWTFLAAIPKGLASAQDIIFLVFLVGGVIALLRRSGAIDALLLTAVRYFERAPSLLIGGTMLLFGAGSFTIGMGEEYIALMPLLVTMCLALRMDAIVAGGIVIVAGGIGWATAGINPFGVLIAQDISGLTPTSGLWFRMILFLVFISIAFNHVYRYASVIKEDPSKSLLSKIDYSIGFEPPADVKLTPQRLAILTLFIGGIGFFVYGAQSKGWYISELNIIFLAIGLATAVISRMGASETSDTFLSGARDMTTAAIIIGFARAIEVTLSDGQIIDTIIYYMASLLNGAGSSMAAVGMLIFQSVINLFIPSGSGQAFVTMPIMSPIAAITGVPQQTAVLAYQFGDGFTNMVVPTNAVFIATLAMAKVPYAIWIKFVWPLLMKLLALAALVLVITVQFPAIFI